MDATLPTQVVITPSAANCDLEIDETGTGYFNGATLHVGTTELVAVDCAPIDIPEPDLGLDKRLSSAPVLNGAGNYELTYTIVVSNDGDGATVYDLSDELLFAGELDVIDVSVANTVPGSITTNANFDGVSDLVVASGVTLPGGSSHTYTVVVEARLLSQMTVSSADCSLADGESGTGFLNEATVTDGVVSLDDDACAEGPILDIAKELIGVPEQLDEDTVRVTYEVTVSNTDVLEARYDLDDRLLFADGLVIDAASVSNTTPGGISTSVTWNGRDDVRVVSDAVIPADGMHVYTVIVDATLPTQVVITPSAANCDLEIDETGTGYFNGATLHVGTTQLVAVDCAPIEVRVPVAVGDFVWVDSDRDGIQDDGESPVPGVTVEIFGPDGSEVIDASGNPVASTTTDDQGRYLFDNLLPGNYYIVFSDLPDGSSFTGQMVPMGSSANDSNANVVTGRTPVFTIHGSATGDTEVDVDPGTVAEFVNPTIDAGIVYKQFDLRITKDLVSAGPFSVGAPAVFELVVTNNGPDAALDGLTVTDRLPVGLAFADVDPATGDDWDCAAPSGRFVTCTWIGETDGFGNDTLTAGEATAPIRIAAVVEVADGSRLVNDAKVEPSPNEPRDETVPVGSDDDGFEDGDPTTGSNNDDSAGLTTSTSTSNEYDLKIAKSLTSAGPFQTGSGVTFELRVTNNGPGDAVDGLTVTDRLPDGLVFTGPGAAGSDWTCAAPVGQDVTCTWDGPTDGQDVLIAGASTTPITITAQVAPGAVGELVNFSRVDPSPDQSGPETIPVGTTNDGFEDGDPTTGSNNDDKASLTVSTPPAEVYDLTIQKVLDTEGPYVAGMPVTYLVAVTNNGPAAAVDGLTVTDRLPVGLTFAAVDPAVGDDWTCAAPVGQELTCTWNGPTAGQDVLVAGASAPVISIHAVIDTPAPSGALVNFAKVDPSPDQPGPETIPVGTTDDGFEDGDPTTGSNNDDSTPLEASEFAPQPYDLTIAKTVTSAGPYQVGSIVTYELVASNLGPAAVLDGITVTDRLPAGLSFQTVTGSEWVCADPVGQDVTCTWLGTSDDRELLTAGGQLPAITVTAIIGADAVDGDLVNLAKVVPPPDQPGTETNPPGTTNDGFEDGDPTTGSNNDDSVKIRKTTPSANPYDLTITKVLTTGGPYKPGQTVSFSLTVTNLGPGTATDGLTVTDRLPAGITFGTATGNGWTCEQLGNGDIACTWNGPTAGIGNDLLTSGASTPSITVTGTIAAGANGTMTNLAKVEPNPDDPTETIPPGTDNDGFEDGDPTKGSNNDDSAELTTRNVVAVGDYTWIDADGDGIQDPDEDPLPGVTVTLFHADGTPARDADGNLVGSTVTDTNGHYLFDNLDPGDYYLEFTLPDGYEFTVNGSGTSADDSNPDRTTGRTPIFTIHATETGDTIADTDPNTLASYVNPTIDAGVITSDVVTVTNPPPSTPTVPRRPTVPRGTLPFTGSNLTTTLTMAGFALLALGAVLVISRRRRALED